MKTQLKFWRWLTLTWYHVCFYAVFWYKIYSEIYTCVFIYKFYKHFIYIYVLTDFSYISIL